MIHKSTVRYTGSYARGDCVRLPSSDDLRNEKSFIRCADAATMLTGCAQKYNNYDVKWNFSYTGKTAMVKDIDEDGNVSRYIGVILTCTTSATKTLAE